MRTARPRTMWVLILVCAGFHMSAGLSAGQPARFDAPRAYVTDPFPLQVIPMDLDDDKDSDAAVLCAPVLDQPRLQLFENPGDGTLVHRGRITLAADTRLAAADLNGDQRIDLVQVYSDNGVTGTLRIMVRTGPFAFSASTQALPFPASRVCVGDLDGQNGPDLVIGDDLAGPRVQVMPADGAGGYGPPVAYDVEDTFRDVSGDGFPEVQTPVTMRDCECDDMNGDLHRDVVVVNSIQRKMSDSGETIYTTDIVLLLNDGTGGLGPYQPLMDWGGDQLGIGDVDADTDLDITSVAVGVQGGDSIYKLILLRNRGPAVFDDPQWFDTGGGLNNVWGPTLADVDGDGDLDAGVQLPGFMAGDTSDHPADHWALLRNDGDGNFSAPEIHPTGADVFDLAFADLDGSPGPEALTVAGDDDRLVVDDNHGGYYAVPRIISIEDPTHPADEHEVSDLVTGDFDADPHPDLAALVTVGNLSGGSDYIARLPGGPFGPVAANAWLAVGEHPWRLHAEAIAGNGDTDIGAVFLGDSLFGEPMGAGLTTGFGQQPPVAMQFAELPGMPNDLTAVEVTGDAVQDLAVMRSRTDEGFAAGLAVIQVSPAGALTWLGDLLLGSDDILDYDSRLPEVITSADMTGDGREDLVAVTFNVFESWHRLVTVIRNDGNLTFWGVGEFDLPSGETVDIIAADVIGSALPDIVVLSAPDSFDTAEPGYLWVMPNLGGGVLGAAVQYEVGQYPQRVVAARIDDDTHMDLAVACDGSNEITVLLNDGQGGFDVQEHYVPGGGADALVAGDFDGDGDTDIASANDDHGMTERHATVSLLFNRNTTPPTATADLNGDGNVDGHDVLQWLQCAAGPAMPHPSTAMCNAADFDDDGDVDQDDFGTLQRCISGEGQPADPNCGQ